MRKFWKRKAVAVVAQRQGEPSGVADVFYRWHYSAQDDGCPSCGAMWNDHVLRHEDGCVYFLWEEYGDVPCSACGEAVVDNWDSLHLSTGRVTCPCDEPKCAICGQSSAEMYEMGTDVVCSSCDEWWNCGSSCSDCDEVAVDGLVCESPDCGNDGECYVGNGVFCKDCASE